MARGRMDFPRVGYPHDAVAVADTGVEAMPIAFARVMVRLVDPLVSRVDVLAVTVPAEKSITGGVVFEVPSLALALA
jgi:hypothetical protein